MPIALLKRALHGDMTGVASTILIGFVVASCLWLLAWRRAIATSQKINKGSDDESNFLQGQVRTDHGGRPALEVLFDGPDADIDIIAVHGLGANVDWTWTWLGGNRRTHWLRDPDMLPAKVPNARIVAYNYDSKWHANAPKVRLALCGRNLVDSLVAFRKGKEDRPIIFLGHSLGGLVICYALLHAQSNEASKDLVERTVGFVSLGTPFRGTSMQSMADWAAKLMVFAGSQRSIIKDLAFDGDALWDKLNQFCEMREQFRLPACCFFELYKTDYGRRFGIPGVFRGMVVDEKSACIPGWDAKELYSDHLKMNKFSGPSDRSYMSVSYQIQSMCNNSKAVLEARESLRRSATHFLVPFGRDKGFVGRTSILDQLMQLLLPSAEKDNCQRTAIEGLGGVGKTSIALEAVYRIRDRYPTCSIFWVPAVDSSTFETAYRRIGQALKIPTIDDSKSDIMALVKTALSRYPGQWLLVIDNADDQRLLFENPAISEHLPVSHNGSIVFTTRTHNVPSRLDIPEVNTIRMTELSRQEATDLLLKNLRKEQTADIQSTTMLLDFLTDLPIAIKQAAAYMSLKDIDTKRYLAYCQSSDTTMIKILSKNFQDQGRYKELKNPITTTWLISFSHIMRDDPLAARLMKLTSLLGEKDIPNSLITAMSDEDLDDLDVEDAIGTLKAYAFVREHGDEASYDVHRLVRLAMRNWLHEQNEFETCANSVTSTLAAVFPLPEDEIRRDWFKLLPHALELLRSTTPSSAEARLKLLENVAQANYELGKHQDSESMYREVLEGRKHSCGADDARTILSMASVADTLLVQGRHAEAEQIFREVLTTQSKSLGVNHSELLDVLTELEIRLSSTSSCAVFEATSRRRLALLREVATSEYGIILSTMDSLGYISTMQGHSSYAEQIHRRTLVLRKKLFGNGHPVTNESTQLLITALNGQIASTEKHDEADSIGRSEVALLESLYGAEHQTTLETLAVLGESLSIHNKYEESESISRQAVALLTKTKGAEHPLTLSAMRRLGLTLGSNGKYDEGEALCRDVLERQKMLLGANHPTTLNTMSMFMPILEENGKLQEGESMGRHVYAHFRELYGPASFLTLNAYMLLGSVLLEQKKYAEAESIFRSILETLGRTPGIEDSFTLVISWALTRVLCAQGRNEEAVKVLRDTLAVQRNVHGPEAPGTLSTMDLLRDVLEDENKLEEAEALSWELVVIQIQVLGVEHQDTDDSMRTHERILRKQGKIESEEAVDREIAKLLSLVPPQIAG